MLPRLHSTVLLFAAGSTLYGCGGGGSSDAPPVVPADTVAPVIVVDTPLDGSLTNQAGQTLIGHLSEPATLTVNGLPALVDASNQFSFGPVTLAEGSNRFALIAADPAGNTNEVALTITLDSIAPAPAGLDAITRSSAIGGSIGIIGLAGSVEAEATVYITNQATSQQVTTPAGSDGAFSTEIAGADSDVLTLVEKATKEVEMADVVLDPNALTIGFARRFATYKRASLFLTDLDRIGARGGETAGGAGGLGGEAEGGDDRRLLHRERHHVILAVDQEVDAEADRHAHDADNVLDHGVGVAQVEDGLTVDESLVVLRRQQTAVAHRAHALLHRQLVERGECGGAHWDACFLFTSVDDPLPSFCGRPRAAALKRALRPKLLRMTTFEVATIAATRRRETLTCAPDVKKGLASILRRVETASRAAQIRKRRIPVSWLGTTRV